MKTILVPIEADEGQEARLQAAFDLARACSGQIVAMQVTKWAALTGSETMPSNLLNDNVLVYGMRYYWAIERDDDNAIQKWKTLYEDEISKNAIHLRNLMGDDDPTYIASPVFNLTQSV